MKHNGLNPAKVKNLTTPGTYTDGDGLTLRVSATGAKSWVLRLTVHGKRRNVGLGSYPAVGLGEARRLAADNVRAAREGRDPVAEKRAARHETRALASAPDFQTVAAQVIELRRPTWTNATHAKQWEGSLALHVFPVLGEKRIDTITTADVMSVLMPIWTSKPETSSRVKHRMATIFDFAVVQGWRPDNPASSALTRALPRRPRLKQHHQALPYSDVRNALQRVRESAAAPVTRLSFQFLVFTVARAGEVRMATWQEMELESATWEIPAERMKARRQHRVPLSGQALEILSQARELDGHGSGLVFPSNHRRGAPLSNSAYEGLLHRLDIPAVPHGFRSSFKNWCMEVRGGDERWFLSEAALAHNLGDATELAYARTDLFEARRPLMQEWADFVAPR